MEKYQSIEEMPPHPGKMEKLHLVDKACCSGDFRSWANDENNMIAATRMFHERFDGMNTTERIPTGVRDRFKADHKRLPSVAIRPAERQDFQRDVTRGSRYARHPMPVARSCTPFSTWLRDLVHQFLASAQHVFMTPFQF